MFFDVVVTNISQIITLQFFGKKPESVLDHYTKTVNTEMAFMKKRNLFLGYKEVPRAFTCKPGCYADGAKKIT